MVPPWSNLFVADVVVLGAPKFLKFVADDDVVTLHFRVTSSAVIISVIQHFCKPCYMDDKCSDCHRDLKCNPCGSKHFRTPRRSSL